MVNNDNKDFYRVYNKLLNTIDIKLKDMFNYRQIGKSIDYNTIKLLNLYIRYLNSVKDSEYVYINVAGLNNISNYLNTL